MKIRLAQSLQPDSIVDGEGIRTVLWTQGCSHHCKGCHNPATHDFNKGFLVEVEDIKKQISNLQEQDGITLSGGDPFFQIEACNEIAEFCHKKGLTVWCYTGYTYEELITMAKENKNILDFLHHIDILVDGKFVIEQKSYDVKFRGSKNQRIINVKESLEQGQVVEVQKYKNEVESEKQENEKISLYI